LIVDRAPTGLADGLAAKSRCANGA
jgi:hypothetical protein